MSKAQTTKASYEGKALDVTKMDKLLKDSSIGYVKAKIWGDGELPGVWGVVNDRDIKQWRKGDMWVSFKKNGIQRCRVDTVIKLPVKRDWVKGTGVSDVEGLSVDEVPELELTEEGIVAGAAELLTPLEGLGRQGGIEMACMELKSLLDTMKARMKKIDGAKTMTAKLKEEKIALGLEMEEMERQLRQMPYWTFQLIDAGR
jgi:hypothetical protein